MELDEIRATCLEKPGATEGFPFGEDVLVFKVMGKMFALLRLEGEVRLNLKCDPARAVELRDAHHAIKPGWHMNKRHWNTLEPLNEIRGALVTELIDHSYDLVVEKLGKKDREALKALR